jgi:hypothetical protein
VVNDTGVFVVASLVDEVFGGSAQAAEDSRGGIDHLDPDTGRAVAERQYLPTAVFALAASSNGGRLLATGMPELPDADARRRVSYLRLLDTASGAPIGDDLWFTVGAIDADISPDGQHVAVTADGTITVMHADALETDRLVREACTRLGRVTSEADGTTTCDRPPGD